MEILEREILDSIKGKKRELTESEISSYVKEDYILFSSIFFHALNDIIEDYPITNNLYYKEIIYDYINIIKEHKEVDLERKIKKVTSRLEFIKSNKLKNKKRAKQEIEDFKNYLNIITKDNIEDDIEDNFINHLINEEVNINYIDYVFEKIPGVINVKDKKGSSLYFNIIQKYLEEVDKDDEEKIEYYKNLLLMITSKKEFKISNFDKKKILEKIYNKIGVYKDNKKADKLNELKNIIIQEESKLEEIARKHNIEIEFSSKLKEIINERKPQDERIRITDYIISIDGNNTVEIDDALSCKRLDNGNYILGVHIASILGYYDYNNPLVQHAFQRGHSIYLKGKMIPIFPLEFAVDTASLQEGKDRLARSYIFEIDKQGNVVRQSFVKSVINNNKRLTYEEANKILEKGTDNKELSKTINNLEEVTNILSNKYKTNTLYEFLKEYNNDYTNLKVTKNGSEKIVYESMLLTGNKVAEFFAKNKYPCLYRVHNITKEENNEIEEIVNNLIKIYNSNNKDEIYNLVNGIYPRSTYDIKGHHKGLGLKNYCHCTSGLRRSSDILVEHCLEVCYDQDPTEEELKKLKEEINNKKDLINTKNKSIEWFIENYSNNVKKRKK